MRTVLVAVVVFLLALELPDLASGLGLSPLLRSVFGPDLFLLMSGLRVVLCFGGLFLVHRVGLVGAAVELGLCASLPLALAFGLVVTLPMLLGIGTTSTVNPQMTWFTAVRTALVAPVAEEVLFRGYLFRQLYAHGGLGFWPAALLVALMFGVAHSWQAVAGVLGLSGLFGIVGITAIGSLLFSWLFLRWRFNLWVPIVLHGLMNLWWEVFAVDETALGGALANVSRLLTVVAAIGLTLWATSSPGKAPQPKSMPPSV